MKLDQQELIIKEHLNSINTPPIDIKKSINNKLNIRPKKYKKRFSLALASFLLLFLSVYVGAQTIPSFKLLLENLSTELGDVLQPIEMSATKNGIKVEVIAVGRFDNIIKLYVSIEDLEQDRINDDLSFMDYYSLSSTKPQKQNNNSTESIGSFGFSILDYDKANKKITLEMQAENNSPLEGEELILKIGKMFVNQIESLEYETGIDLTKLINNPPVMNLNTKDMYSWGSSQFKLDDIIYKISDTEPTPALIPNENITSFPEIKHQQISNIGIIDGKLHIQTYRDPNYDMIYNNLYLINKAGDRIGSSANFCFALDKNGNITKDLYKAPYDEYIFLIDGIDLSEYKLLGDFTSYDELKGDWKVKFSAENNGKVISRNIDYKNDYLSINKITINPFGINLFGNLNPNTKTNEKQKDLSISFHQNDKIYNTTSSSFTTDKTKEFIIYHQTETPIDIDLIDYILINGEKILISKESTNNK